MFEDVCLACGKNVVDEGSAYCSEECRTVDACSPSISSTSSALSSPHIDFAIGGEVPPLIPSALGYAFNSYHNNEHYSSSSASSTSWSVTTDDEDDAPGLASDQDDSLYDGSFKSVPHARNSAMSYTRRPSGTNNRSTVPRLHRRTSSGSMSGHVQGVPQSAPIHFHSPTDEMNVRYGSCSDALSPDSIVSSDSGRDSTTKPKRNRNRASLPAYFSLLQMSASPSAQRQPSLSSSGQTIALPRASPPTPKLSLADVATAEFAKSSLSSVQCTSASFASRGRRRDIGAYSIDSSPSRSASRHASPRRSDHRNPSSPNDKSPGLTTPVVLPRQRVGSKGSVEQVFDWSSVPRLPLVRGRAAVRRNSSPPPKVAMSIMNLGLGPDPTSRLESGFESSVSPSPIVRGRHRVEELDGIGGMKEAPGYGNGRSGLLDRERRSRQQQRF